MTDKQDRTQKGDKNLDRSVVHIWDKNLKSCDVFDMHVQYSSTSKSAHSWHMLIAFVGICLCIQLTRDGHAIALWPGWPHRWQTRILNCLAPCTPAIGALSYFGLQQEKSQKDLAAIEASTILLTENWTSASSRLNVGRGGAAARLNTMNPTCQCTDLQQDFQWTITVQSLRTPDAVKLRHQGGLPDQETSPKLSIATNSHMILDRVKAAIHSPYTCTSSVNGNQAHLLYKLAHLPIQAEAVDVVLT